MLETIAILETSAASGPIAPFEFALASHFIKNCMVTAFPDTRQKMMKTISSFLVRLRTLYAKDIKRYEPALAETEPERHDQLWAPLNPLYGFIADVTEHAEENLYLDKPIEGAFPLFDVIKLIMDLFGGIEYKQNKAHTFYRINFLAKAKGGHLLSSRSLFMFFINSLKSSWTNVRLNSYELLSKYADEYAQFHNTTFVNGILVPTALDFLNDPRAMMAEASALMLKLAFVKCIDVVDLSLIPRPSDAEAPATNFESPTDKRLLMLNLILAMVKQRLQTFQSSLISEGSTSALMHGLLAFFKHVFTDFSIGGQAELGEAKFL